MFEHDQTGIRTRLALAHLLDARDHPQSVAVEHRIDEADSTLQILHDNRVRCRVDQVSGILDVEDPIAGEYTLEVSSPGWDRPLYTLAHYQRFVASEVSLRLVAPINARRRYKGVIQAVTDDAIELSFEDQVIRIPFAQIDKGNLVPSV